jgi:alcohol dehydrogenase YqhD (iron-dependent ADH family)
VLLDFIFENSTKILFGKSMYNRIFEEINKYGKKVLLVYGGTSIIKNGLYKDITEKAKLSETILSELPGIKPNPTLNTVKKGIEICKKNEIEFILAVGGGSVIDTAKAIALGVKTESDVWEYFEGIKNKVNPLPVGVILTIAAAGSESSNNTIITNETINYKRAFGHEALRPKFALLNPEFTYTLPQKQTIAGGIDIISHVFERYFTKVRGVDLTDRLCEGLIKSMIKNMRIVLKNPNDYEARAEIMWSGTLAHNGLLGTGRQEDWGAHMIAHEISAIHDITHGFTLSVIIPAWMKYVYREDIVRFVQYANRVWDIEIDLDNLENTALKGIEMTEKFFNEIGAPTRFCDLGIDEIKLEEMSNKCIKYGKVGAFKVLDCEDVRKIYELAM